MTVTAEFNNVLNAIANDIVAYLETVGNTNNTTVETLRAKWEYNVEWLGLKVGGKAWRREVFSQARTSWIATTQKTSRFIPASHETNAWGCYEGGQNVSTHAMREDAETAFAAKFGTWAR